MPLKLEQQEHRWLVRLDGQVTLASAAELKQLLVEWCSSGKNLELDLDRVEEIDLAIMQLLWAAAFEADRSGREISGQASDAAAVRLCAAGFDEMSGFRFRCGTKTPRGHLSD